MEVINNKYRILSNIGKGAFGSIFKAENIRTNELVAIKIECVNGPTKLLLNESKIYQFLLNTPGIPKVKWFGRDAQNYYMVIELLGESLQDKKDKINIFSLKTTLQIGIQILKILKILHEKGLVHRDIKPENFLIGLGNKDTQIYIIDFGFCKLYSTDERKHVSSLIGSLNYASIHAHELLEQSPRDDLESLGYMLLYFIQGKLPWQDDRLNLLPPDEKNKSICLMKQHVSTEKTTNYIIAEYMKRISALKFKEFPDYQELIEIFEREIKLYI